MSSTIATKYASILEKLIASGQGGIKKNMPSEIGLKRTRDLLERIIGDKTQLKRLGDKVVHVVGTNGKGSVAWKTANTLVKNGLCKNVGLYTSPHLLSVRERIRVNGQMIGMTHFIDLAEEVLAAASGSDSSYFELMTCMAVSHFARTDCDALVLEAGMGGKGDSTNLLDSSRVVALTSIGLDHTAVLGSTTDLICREKIGVVKTGSKVIVGPGVSTGLDSLIHEICVANGASSITRILPTQAMPTLFEYDLENERVARACVQEFSSTNLQMDTTRPRCRLEIVLDEHSNKQVILDVGHNPAALSYVIKSINQRFTERKGGLVFSIAADKDVKGCVNALLWYPWKRIEFTTFPSGEKGRRFTEPKTLAGLAKASSVTSSQIGFQSNLRTAIRTLLNDDEIDFILVCGSHALMADALRETSSFTNFTKEFIDPFDMNERGAKDVIIT